jgi:monofunctional biosynthetic peptidoglycan transglycosylase
MRGPSRLLRRIAVALVLLPLVGAAAILALGLLYSAVTPPSTLMLGRWIMGKPVARTAVLLEAIAPALPAAAITSEDARYCQHSGVDWSALRDVVDDEDGPSRGASTIAMQTAKNVFLWPGRSYIRKALELPVALVLDFVWGKRRMMEIYLNIAEWGEGVFGAEAAAQRWFNKSARQLSRGEAALLVAALPNPLARNPVLPSRQHRALAARLLARMEASAPLTECLGRGSRTASSG